MSQTVTPAHFEKAFQDSVDYANKTRVHGSYIRLNSKTRQDAFKQACRELFVASNPTGIIVWGNHMFRLEPIFNPRENEYVMEEVVWLGSVGSMNEVLANNPALALSTPSPEVYEF